jgi:hypothetical protein
MLRKTNRLCASLVSLTAPFAGLAFDLVMQERDLEAKFASLPPHQEKKLRAELMRLGFSDIEVQSVNVDRWPTRQSFA